MIFQVALQRFELDMQLKLDFIEELESDMEKIEHEGISACEVAYDFANLQYYMTSQIFNGDAYVMFLEYCKGIYKDYNHRNTSFEPIKRAIKKAQVELKAKVQIQDMLYDDS